MRTPQAELVHDFEPARLTFPPRRFLKAKTRQLGLQNVGTRPIGPTLKVRLQ